jgi:hypothetical protein
MTAARVMSVHELRLAELAAVSPAGRIEFRIQRELKNHNARNRNPHWSRKHAQRQIWQTAMCNALVTAIGINAAQRLLVAESGLFGAKGARCEVRRRIEITRLVATKRKFVRDTFENLPWAAKELRDAIKNLGLIRDDSAKWTETVITQEVSTDGTSWTWIAIDAPQA